VIRVRPGSLADCLGIGKGARANSFTVSALAIPASRFTGAGAGDGDTAGSTIVTLAAASVAGSADKGATAVVISAVAIVDFNSCLSDEAVRCDAAADTGGVAGADATDDETEESSPAAAGTSAEIGVDTTPVCSSAGAFGGIAE
jgi:hypothetical protein